MLLYLLNDIRIRTYQNTPFAHHFGQSVLIIIGEFQYNFAVVFVNVCYRINGIANNRFSD